MKQPECNEDVCQDLVNIYEKGYELASPGYRAKVVVRELTHWKDYMGCPPDCLCLPIVKHLEVLNTHLLHTNDEV